MLPARTLPHLPEKRAVCQVGPVQGSECSVTTPWSCLELSRRNDLCTRNLCSLPWRDSLLQENPLQFSGMHLQSCGRALSLPPFTFLLQCYLVSTCVSFLLLGVSTWENQVKGEKVPSDSWFEMFPSVVTWLGGFGACAWWGRERERAWWCGRVKPFISQWVREKRRLSASIPS